MIYDCFTFFNELDILEARLHEMSPFVDRFVLVEATKTFTGLPKPLHFAENKARFASFLNRIEHIVVDFPDDMSHMVSSRCTSTTWAREWYQRQQFWRGLQGVSGDDLVLVADVDEIISSEGMTRALSTRRRGDLTVFTMPLYSYFIDRRIPRFVWKFGPRMIEFDKFTDGQKLRMTTLWPDKPARGSALMRMHRHSRNMLRRVRMRATNLMRCGIGARVVEIPHSGWHLSSIGTWAVFREKILAYSHEERKDSDIFKCEDAYMRFVTETTEEVPITELPDFVQCNLDRFPRMCDYTLAAA